MGSCTDEKTGALRMQYELGQLSEADCERYEEHLLGCDYCFRELSAAIPWIAALLENRAEIRENLRREGLTFESQKALYLQTLSASAGPQVRSENLRRRWSQRLRTKPTYAILLPVSAVALAAILLLFMRPSPEPSSPYIALLQFEPIPYEQSVVRGESENAAEMQFLEGMHWYRKGNYRSAERLLKAAVDSAPDNGIYRLFLGVTYFLDRRADAAIQELSAADSLTQFAFKEKVRWYLAQAYLLKSEPEQAIPLLEWMAQQSAEYADHAAELLKRIE